VIIGIILLVYGGIKLELVLSVLDFFALIIMIISATLIYTSIKLFIASLAFWIKRSQSILYMFYMTADFSKYPIAIYHKSIRFFITYIVPFALTAYVPASYYLGANSLLYSLGLTVLASVILSCFAYYTFKVGTDQYESVGN
jgi:ABC-2 type transport system permease protein